MCLYFPILNYLEHCGEALNYTPSAPSIFEAITFGHYLLIVYDPAAPLTCARAVGAVGAVGAATRGRSTADSSSWSRETAAWSVSMRSRYDACSHPISVTRSVWTRHSSRASASSTWWPRTELQLSVTRAAAATALAIRLTELPPQVPIMPRTQDKEANSQWLIGCPVILIAHI